VVFVVGRHLGFWGHWCRFRCWLFYLWSFGCVVVFVCWVRGEWRIGVVMEEFSVINFVLCFYWLLNFVF